MELFGIFYVRFMNLLKLSVAAVACAASISFAESVSSPNGPLRNAGKSDFFSKAMQSEKSTEAWTYQFVFDNGTRAYVNYATLIIPTSGKKISCDISIVGLKGKNSSIGRQYPLERYKEFQDKNRISIKEEYVMEGLPGKGHRVLFTANKEGFGKFLLDVTFTSAHKGKVPGDGKWKVDGKAYGEAVLIPYGRVKGKVAHDGDTVEVKGYGYLEHTWQSGNATDLAVRAFNLSEASRGSFSGRIAMGECGVPFGYLLQRDGDSTKALFPKEVLENGKPYSGKKFPKSTLKITWRNSPDTLSVDMSKPRQKFSMLENFDGWIAKKATKLMLGGEIFFWRGRSKADGNIFDWNITGF